MTDFADAKVQRFLDTKEVVVLATVQPDGAPLAMAMWFLHDPAALTMISVAGLQKIRNLRRDPRVSVVAEAGGGGTPLCGVAVQGRAEFLADGAERRALVDRFHRKYADLKGYWGGHDMPGDRVMFRIVPTRVREWGL
jgi:PPOX class probable F420-dependent enzyme